MNQEQFELSTDLLYFLYWLVQYDPSALKKLADHAVSSNFKQEVQAQLDLMPAAAFDELQNSVGDFLNTLDEIIVQSVQEHIIKQAVEKKLLPALSHIDASVCDQEMVADCVEQATFTLNEKNRPISQDFVLKELLKQWRPIKKTAVN
jgi:hypothetical protein